MAQPPYSSNMNKILRTSILFSALLLSLSACQKAENVSFEKQFTVDTAGTGIEGDGDVGPVDVSFDLSDYATIEENDNPEKAKIALLFSANICLFSRVKINDREYIPDNYQSYSHLFSYFQFNDVKEYNTEGQIDKTDISRLVLGHHFVKKDKQTYDIVFCSIIDSSINDTWESNLNVGYDDESYYSKTGEHPEWTDKQNHKGFDVSANRCVDKIEEYVSSIKKQKTPQILYIFGHSRGGAVSNLAAKKLIDKGYTTVAYTLASPLTTTSSDYNNSKYKNIYNYVNDCDPVTMLPSSAWGFKRFGQDIRFDIREHASSFKQIVGVDLPEPDDVNIIDNIFSSICTDISQAYVFDEKFTLATSKPLNDESAVNQYISEQLAKYDLEFEPLQKFLKFDVNTNDDNKLIVKVISCPAMISHMIGIALSMYGLSSAISSVAVQYYSVLTVYTKLAGYSSPLSLKNAFNATTVSYMHFFQSYMSYLWA